MEGEGAVLGVNFAHPIVTDGAFATWLFSIGIGDGGGQLSPSPSNLGEKIFRAYIV